ncbi:MAG: protein kinase [Chloroflexi bacterium]|nr:protein kinase [Chloroflexota bacterium]
MLPATPIIGRRYILRESLGTGGMGAVFRATDRLTGDTVALKRVSPLSDQFRTSSGSGLDSRMALAQEFKILASLRHPHIISVLDYGFDEQGLPYYTMELLEGARTILEAGHDQPLPEQVRLLVQMLQALAYLHRRGITHRDLKPSNVLVVGGQVKVLDFGLSLAGDQRAEGGSTAVGTLAYMAPEVLIGGVANERTDLYAVGIIAYELLTGRHPFAVRDVTRLINDILYNSPDTAGLNLEPRLTQVLARLLTKSPDARYSSAVQVMRELSEAASITLALETAATRESFLQAAQLIGRDAELKRLSGALEAAINGRGSAWLVAGESGVGKSRLVDELRALALVQGALVLRGQATAEKASPYQLLRPALRWLCLVTELDESQLSTLQLLVPDLDTLLERPLPKEELDWKAAQARIIGVIEDIFRRQRQPVVVILEDLHWAGESLEVLARLAQIVGELPVLLIGCYRDDERPELPSRLPGMHVLKLERLSDEGISELSAAMLGEAGRREQVLDLLKRETEGNVFFLVEVVRVLAEEAGQLDRIGMATLPMHVFEGGVRQIIQRRLTRVPPAARPLLRIAAILGRELDLSVLKYVDVGVDLDHWLSACADAAVLEVNDGKWRFAHHKLRDGVLAELSEDARRTLHGLIAETMERVYANVPEQIPIIAYHFGKAGNRAREQHYAVLAGAQSLTGGAYREAVNWLERALALVTQSLHDADPDRVTTIQRQQVVLRRQLAGARLGLGQYAAARQLYDENLVACRHLHDRQGEADTLHSLGDTAQALGETAVAKTLYRLSLALFRELNDAVGVARALNSLGNVAYDEGELAEAKRLYQESLALARGAGSGWGMAGSIASGKTSTQEARVLVSQSFHDQLKAYRESRSRADLQTGFDRLLPTETGRYADVEALYREALAEFRAADDYWATATALMYLGWLAIRAGQLAEAVAHLREALQLALDLPDAALGLAALAAIGQLLLRRGQPDTGIELLALALHHPQSAEKTQDEAERLLLEAQTTLPPERVKAGWERGKTRPFEATARDLLAGGTLLTGSATA